MVKKFFDWYNKHYTLNLSIAAFLFMLQLIHLYWLTTNVVILKLFGAEVTGFQGVWQLIMIFVDYTEIPALITTTLVYINEYRLKGNFKSLLYLFFINSQFLHIFWITDEFVIEQFGNMAKDTILPFWLAWVAIVVDYLELPVIFETTQKVFTELKKRQFKKAAEMIKKVE